MYKLAILFHNFIELTWTNKKVVENPFANFLKKIRNLEIKPLYNTFWRKEHPGDLYIMQLNVWTMELEQRDVKVQVDRPKKCIQNRWNAFNEHFDHKDGKSQREAARKFQITQPYVCKLLKDLSIDFRAKKTIPYRYEQQAKEAKTK